MGFSLKLLRCRARAFFCSYGTGNGGHFNNAHVCTHVHHPSARADSEAAGGAAKRRRMGPCDMYTTWPPAIFGTVLFTVKRADGRNKVEVEVDRER